MRRRNSRGLAVAAGVALLAPLSQAAGPVAYAATAPVCGTGSVVIPGSLSPVTVRLYEASETTTHVCVDASGAHTVVVFEADSPVWAAVTIETAPGTCTIKVVDTPPYALSVGADPANAAVCVGTASGRQTVQLHYGTTGAWPNVDVWANYACTLRIIQTHRRGGDDDAVCTGADEKLI